ncbi:MAG: D-alanyl-D-alanine carboxypeptidase/D-alanyl-D-alanine endopeptidase [Fermentimonas sp.]|jgi:D-alanyl-D-alanine carboxypeptidase/D-alanyl-D-alanine-endopeptidase (penicillin-binding protein 4)
MWSYYLRNGLICAMLLLSAMVNAQQSINQLINNQALKHASVGVSVVDLNSGNMIVEHNGVKSMTPASVMKIMTTSTALEVLGANWRYKTEVALDADDPTRILVIGAGDPTLGSDVFQGDKDAFFINATNLIKKSLPNDVEYSVYVVDELFGYDGVSPEWTWIDLGNYYASATYGISLYDNTYRLIFNTTDLNSCPKIVRTDPNIVGLNFTNKLTLNNTGRDNAYIYGAPFSNERTVSGNIPGGRSTFSIKGDIPDPGLLLGQTLARYMNKAGYKVKEVNTSRDDYLAGYCDVGTKKNERYRVGQSLFTYVSRPMREIVREINVKSNNHYAEHLIRTIGRFVSSDTYSDALELGTKKVSDFWKSKGVDVTSLTMHDGSGLAPQDAVSPQMLTDVMYYMYAKSLNKDDFAGSLPKAGQEGTVINFMKNSKYNGKIIAKSGSIGGVQCYVGYLFDGDKKYAFSIMINKFNGTRTQVRSAIEKFLLSL